MLPDYIVVWICPVCSEYYASSNAGDLQSKFNTDVKGEVTFTRARCPTLSCAASGVIRVPIKIKLPQNVADGHLSASKPNASGSPRWSGRFCERCTKQIITTGDMDVCSGCGRVIIGQSHP